MGDGTAVAVGGTFVGVAVGGASVDVGGTGVAVGEIGVEVGGTGVAVDGIRIVVGRMEVGVAVGDAQPMRTTKHRTSASIKQINGVCFFIYLILLFNT